MVILLTRSLCSVMIEYMAGLLTPECSADEIAAWAASALPADVVSTPLAEIAPEQLSQDGTLNMIVALERLMSWCDSQLLQHLAHRAEHADVSPCATAGEEEDY